MMGRNARSLAAQAVASVISRGQSLDETLADSVPQLAAPADAGLLKELCYGTLRWRFRLEAPLRILLKRPFKRRDTDLHALLLIGLYQLVYMRVPDHAAVAETVGAAKALGKPWARGLVNATLRNFLRRRDELLAAADSEDISRYAHPEWLIERLRADWPESWQTIVEANNARPPMTLRVNRRHATTVQIREQLAEAGMDSQPVATAADALMLSTPVEVSQLPGFAEGHVSVQDAGAQLAATVLDVAPGQRVLDACAAPGGKTCHILECCPDLAECVALDVSASRLVRVRENLERGGLTASLLAGDGRQPEEWWDGRPFDRILLDAPCSATGVIRRHPDIKSLRRADDIESLARVQAALLDALWFLLAPGGKLVYATCSVLRVENEACVAAFQARTADVRVVSLPSGWGREAGAGRQILPGENGMDGFYYACLGKVEK